MDFEKEVFGRNKQKRHDALLHIIGSTGTSGLVELFEGVLDRIEALRKRLSRLESAAEKWKP